HCGRRKGWPAQDVHAAGRRTRKAAGNRSPRRRGDRAGAADGHTNSTYRFGICLHAVACADDCRCERNFEDHLMTENAVTIPQLLEVGAEKHTAITAPGGVPLSYGALRAQVAATVSALNSRGIGRNDRVAIVLDNGPEMATAFLGVAAGATAAPLNPAYRADEFEFYLTDLRAKLLIYAAGKETPAEAVANKLGVPIARLVAHPEEGAGSFT